MRITASLSETPASFGNSSQNRTPGMRVGMVANGPRYSSGAFGFGSKVSSWLGPPHSHSRMTAFADPGLRPPDSPAPSRSASDSPRTELAPTWRNARRVSVWQVRCGLSADEQHGERLRSSEGPALNYAVIRMSMDQ